jgi:hypothetical protein
MLPGLEQSVAKAFARRREFSVLPMAVSRLRQHGTDHLQKIAWDGLVINRSAARPALKREFVAEVGCLSNSASFAENWRTACLLNG